LNYGDSLLKAPILSRFATAARMIELHRRHGSSPSPRAARLSVSCDARGNRRQQTFFEDGDYVLYRDLLAEAELR
jgi:hypothetical protein